MGTASLVIGLALIIFGFYLIIQAFNTTYEVGEAFYELFAVLIISVPLIVGGALLLRKFDKDRKKEKNS